MSPQDHQIPAKKPPQDGGALEGAEGASRLLIPPQDRGPILLLIFLFWVLVAITVWGPAPYPWSIPGRYGNDLVFWKSEALEMFSKARRGLAIFIVAVWAGWGFGAGRRRVLGGLALTIIPLLIFATLPHLYSRILDSYTPIYGGSPSFRLSGGYGSNVSFEKYVPHSRWQVKVVTFASEPGQGPPRVQGPRVLVPDAIGRLDPALYFWKDSKWVYVESGRIRFIFDEKSGRFTQGAQACEVGFFDLIGPDQIPSEDIEGAIEEFFRPGPDCPWRDRVRSGFEHPAPSVREMVGRITARRGAIP